MRQNPAVASRQKCRTGEPGRSGVGQGGTATKQVGINAHSQALQCSDRDGENPTKPHSKAEVKDCKEPNRPTTHAG
jgi:hypothetical protein